MAYTAPKTWSAGAVLPASELNTYVRDNTIYLKTLADAAPVSYAATLLPATNTAAEVTACAFTVPASDWSDGDRIFVFIESLNKANGLSGGVGTMAAKVNCGAGAQVTLGTSDRADDATEYTVGHAFHMVRLGSVVSIYQQAIPSHFGANGNSAGARLGSSTPTNFTTSFVVSVKVTLSEAVANFWYKPQSALVYRVKKA